MQSRLLKPETRKMSGSSSGEFYILTRDQDESLRLDSQHRFFVEVCDGKLIHESISEEKIFSVADVATGTGIWLRDVQKYLDTKYPTDNKRHYQGFDISDIQLAKDRTIQFSLHNCLEPFPSEHHGKYDLVHVRLMVAALKESDYVGVVANIAALLKPGGHLQWEDLDHSYFLTNPEKHYQELPGMDTLRLGIEGQINAGASSNAPAAVAAAAQSAGLTKIARYDFRTRDKPELWPMTEMWMDKALEALMRVFLNRRRRTAADLWRSDDEIEEEVRRRLHDLKDAHEKGFVMHATMGMVVAQKP